MKKEDIMAISVAVANSVVSGLSNVIAEVMNAANAAKDEDKEKDEKPKRTGGFRRRKASGYQPEERVVNIREYSQKVWVVYGDCKPLAEWFKEFSQEKNMGFCPVLAAVPEKPCGWWAKRGMIESGFGGIDGFVKAIQEKGFTVNILESVVEVKEAMDKAKGKKDKKAGTTKVEAVPQESKPAQASEPTPAPAEPAKPSAAKPTPKPTAKFKSVVKNCYEPDGMNCKLEQREVVARNGYWFYQGKKGARIYAVAGQDTATREDVLACIAVVKGECDIATSVLPQMKDWEAIAKNGIHKSVLDGKLPASFAYVQAYADCGNTVAVDELYALYAAA